ncbi:hypothetical protein [Streptomyces subrutilus]|uniref:Uncharacterized protein n=1 Tax=Streptomyces subrutilus TaxID=36818 RepID=A0A1E5PKG8_9ACTN|nr:hypothetical protein [Streptomyces subrutilus]OEJ30035.1 hypothetical protein BGK67_00310 [Streptomyces subrutilus]
MTTVREPAKGAREFNGDKGNVSKVEAVLTAEVSRHIRNNKVTVTYEAIPYLKDSGFWFGENNELAAGWEPKMDITLTLTEPHGRTVSETIKVVGKKVPYTLKAEHVFSYLSLGTHKVTVSGVKTGGRRGTDGRNNTGQDRVVLGEMSLEITVSGD